ncbi:hypothetical protein KLP28_11065 [Nocardioidaceae bacterium]|nr:hypothetical protein KLP28_11065 [Nocardioidaceae bacterium]
MTMRVAVVRSARSARAVLVDSVLTALDRAGHVPVEVPVTTGATVDLGCYDAVLLLSPAHPSLRARPGAWRAWDRWHATTVPWLTSVARDAGVRRLVLQSSALVYADGGGEEVDERSSLAVTAATEPWCAAESATHRFVDGCHTAVVLRLAPLRDDPSQMVWLEAAAERPASCLQVWWQSTTTVAEAADAMARALHCTGGIFNVGSAVSGPGASEAHRRAADRFVALPSWGHLLPWRGRTPERLEPYTRSVRLQPDRFTLAAGWAPDAARRTRG